MRKQTKRVQIRNIVLRSLAVAGGISLVVMAPKVTRFLKELDRPAKNRAQLYRRIRQATARLEQEGLITVSGAGTSWRAALTEKGKKRMAKIEFGEYVIPEQAFWDGKWRILMFDVREERRRVREQLRRMLHGVGFVRLQDSVWVHPYPCDEFVGLLRAHLRSGVGEIRTIVAEALESDRALRAHFRLG